jgi:hypothetical protein
MFTFGKQSAMDLLFNFAFSPRAVGVQLRAIVRTGAKMSQTRQRAKIDLIMI